MGTAKVGEKGQIVIPKEARELLGIRPGDTLLVLADPDRGLLVSRPEDLSKLAETMMEHWKGNPDAGTDV